MYYKQIAIEAFIVGILLVAIGMAIAQTPCFIKDPQLRKARDLFLAGVITHVVFEIIGANKWYCKRGAACIPESKK